jgi:hypothetical protein
MIYTDRLVSMIEDESDGIPPDSTVEPTLPDDPSWIDPSSSTPTLLEKKHQMELSLLRDQFDIRESTLIRDRQILETRALVAEQAIEDVNSALLERELDAAKSKESARQFQKDFIQTDYKYQNLLRKLFSTFDCSRIEDVLTCADQFRIQKTQIENLQKSLLDTQLLLSAETLKRTDLAVHPAALNMRRLEEQIRALERTVQTQQDSLTNIEAIRDSHRRESESAISQKTAEIDRLNEDLKKLIDVNKTLISENFELKANATNKRLQMMTYISERMDPAFLGLERSSLLHPMFESLSLLLRSIGDLDVESEVIIQSLAKVSEDAIAAASQINVSQFTEATEKVNDERVAALKSQLHEQAERQRELEDVNAQLAEELDELRNDDKAPEVFALMMKVREQGDEIRRLKERAGREGKSGTLPQRKPLPSIPVEL